MTQQEQENLDNNNNSDEKMAVQFPDWDLLPPDVLIKRAKNEQKSE